MRASSSSALASRARSVRRAFDARSITRSTTSAMVWSNPWFAITGTPWRAACSCTKRWSLRIPSIRSTYRDAGRVEMAVPRALRCERWRASSSTPSTKGTARTSQVLGIRVEEPRHHVDPLHDDRGALGRGSLDQRADPDPDGRRLLAEPGEQRVRAVGPRAPVELEGGHVQRRHRVLGHDRAHHLADRVGGDDADDAHPGRQLRRDGGLARAGGAADQDDERHAQRLHLAPAQVVERVGLSRAWPGSPRACARRARPRSTARGRCRSGGARPPRPRRTRAIAASP